MNRNNIFPAALAIGLGIFTGVFFPPYLLERDDAMPANCYCTCVGYYTFQPSLKQLQSDKAAKAEQYVLICLPFYANQYRLIYPNACY